LTSIALSHLTWPQQPLAVFLVLTSGGRELYRSWPGSKGYLRQLQLSPDGQLLCAFMPGPGLLVPVTVLHWWTVCARVTGLVVRREDGRRTRTILFRDQLQPDQWRQLGTCLRLGPA
jgi:hypothetical protein